MASVPKGAAQVLARYGNHSISCNPYAMVKLGVDKSHCFLKIEDYMILCAPYQIGFKRSLFIASLSVQEMAFFQKYKDSNVGLSISLSPKKSSKSQEPIKFFIRCSLTSINAIKGRENTGVCELGYKIIPDDLVVMLGHFLEIQDRIKVLYDDYGKNSIKMTMDVSKSLGYNMFALVGEPKTEPKRIQVYMISSKNIEYLEAAGGKVRVPGSTVTYQLFFQKYRIAMTGIIQNSTVLPNGLIRTVSSISFSPELVEIIDDYWTQVNSKYLYKKATSI
jgi:hypothetical protein